MEVEAVTLLSNRR